MAGVWPPDLALAAFCIGDLVDGPAALKAFGGRISITASGNWRIESFVKFQYGELNPESRVHSSVIKTLVSHGIPYANPRDRVGHTVKDKDKANNKDNANAKNKEKAKEEQPDQPF